jgi:tetratricopeptide (TPR) repeat protein
MKSAPALMRDLLRSLDDRCAVSRNSLVSSYFSHPHDDAAYDRVRSGVLQAVETLKPGSRTRAGARIHSSRQYEIVVRYDLGGQSIEDILRVLSIEKSQFYRERTRALTAILERLRENLAPARAAVGTLDASEYRIAAVLQQSGNFDLALGILERMAGAAADPVERAHCRLRIAELRLDVGDVTGAQQHLQFAEECAGVARSEPLRCHLQLVRAQIAWAGGRTQETQRRLHEAIAGLKEHAGIDPFARILLGKAVSINANVTFHVSTLAECANVVAYGCQLSGPTDELARDLYADFLTVRTSIHTATLETLESARADDDALLQFAKSHGLLRKFAVGIKDLAVINHYRGHRSQAEIYAEQALALSSVVSGAKELAVATFEWACTYADTCDESALARSHELIAEIRRRLPRGGYWWGYSFATDGYVLLAGRRAEDALHAAAEALSTFRFVKSDRGIGIARALQARGLRMLGETDEAEIRAQQAVAHLERAPNPFWLRYAQRALSA